MKITVIGTGYVGLSNAVLLARNNEVVAVDINEHKVETIRAKLSPIEDAEIQEHLTSNELNLTATTNLPSAVRRSDFVIVATPTDYDPDSGSFDTSSVESAIEDIRKSAPEATIVIKSTVPVGFTHSLKEKYSTGRIIFSPEFLRELSLIHI